MNTKAIGKKIIAAITASATALSMSSAVISLPVSAASTCVIDTTAEYQTIRGFGGINLPEWVGSDMTTQQVQKAFGNGEDELGLSILRVYVSDNSSYWNRVIPTAKTAQELGATIFATPWNPPEDMCEMFDRDGDSSNGSEAKRLRHDMYGEYAQHLNDYLAYMESQGIDIYSISVQNEPDYAHTWTWWTPEECVDFIVNYGDEINCRLMSPESFQYVKNYYNAILGNSEAFANIDLFGTHFYGTSRNNMDFPALENSGKEIWMTEVYVPNSEADSADRWPEAIEVSENIHDGLVVGNMNAYVWWYIRRNYGLMKEDGTISKRGYCMAQYSKYIRPGDIRIDATEQPADNVLVSAYKNDNNQVTIVAVNKGTESYSQEFSIGSGESIVDVDRYRTSASENIAETLDLEHSTDSFWAQLPGESVSTFVVTLDGEGQPPEPPVDENGYFFHDTFEGDTFSWNGRGNASVLTSGRTAYAGSESLLVQERTSSWHGASKSLSTKTFIPGNEYSFSANVCFLDGDISSDVLKLTLQYTDSNGDTKYSNIAAATAIKGNWVQLANTSYTIPEGASDLMIYVEAENSEINFYIDEAIGAPGGTVIEGAAPISYILGDVNIDGEIDVFDIAFARQGLISGFSNSISELAFDVNQDGEKTVADLVMLQNYLLGRINKFE